MKGISQSGSFNETTSLEIIDPFASVSSVLSGTKTLRRWSRHIQENLHKKSIRISILDDRGGTPKRFNRGATWVTRWSHLHRLRAVRYRDTICVFKVKAVAGTNPSLHFHPKRLVRCWTMWC